MHSDDILLALNLLAVSPGRHTGGKKEIDLSPFFKQEIYAALNHYNGLNIAIIIDMIVNDSGT